VVGHRRDGGSDDGLVGDPLVHSVDDPAPRPGRGRARRRLDVEGSDPVRCDAVAMLLIKCGWNLVPVTYRPVLGPMLGMVGAEACCRKDGLVGFCGVLWPPDDPWTWVVSSG